MRQLEFGTTGFYPAFDGVSGPVCPRIWASTSKVSARTIRSATDCFGEMRDAAERPHASSSPADRSISSRAILASSPPASCQSRSSAKAARSATLRAAIRRRRGGFEAQRIADMERDIGYLRTYIEGGEVDFGNRTSRLESAKALSWQPIPIQMVCSGPKAIALAARKADRICLGIGTNVERVTWALAIINETLAASGRDRDSVRIGMFAPLLIDEVRDPARAGCSAPGSLHGPTCRVARVSIFRSSPRFAAGHVRPARQRPLPVPPP